jgi:hypothetical protein
VADLAGGPVDGAGAAALDAPLAFAPGADRAAPRPALDVAGAFALGAGAERGQVQEPHPGGEDGEDGQDEGAHRGSPVSAAGRADGVPFRPALGVAAGLADGIAFRLAVAEALFVDAAGVPLAVLVPARLVAVLCTYTGG